jgi:hypothetical protein
LKGTLYDGLQYRRDDDITLTGYSDSDYAGDKTDRKSTTGFVFMMNGSPISWCSQKQPVVAVWSTEAEYVALSAAAKEAVWMRQFLAELKFQQESPTDLYVDNTSVIKLAHNPEFHQRFKHIDVRFHFTGNLIELNAIRVSYIQTNEQPVDILTNFHYTMGK